MKYVRTNVYAKGGDFSDPTLLWYAKGIQVMQKRALADPTSLRFYAAIHGIDPKLWALYGYLSATDKKPPQPEVDLYWSQCQHNSWYFLPWHRGYLLGWEATVRDAVVSLGGPSDWALPYWNYFAPGENQLPPAFASPDWPGGQGDNPLYVKQRWGPDEDGAHVYVPLDQVNLNALAEPEYTGVASGGSPGFGGVDTGFEHGGGGYPFGLLENQPHNAVHGLVGGTDPQNPMLDGLMAVVETAGLDPIFWLHHANIDRLWEVWLHEALSQGNPTDPSWLNGPTGAQRKFVMPWPPSGQAWHYTPADVGNLAKLDYVYDDLSSAAVSQPVADQLESLRVATGATEGSVPMAAPRHNVELVGASEQRLPIAGRDEVRAHVRLDAQARRRVTANLASAAAPADAAAAPPDRVFLNLENVQGLLDSTVLQVYVHVPEGANPADYPERLAGTVALFGVRKATVSDGDHAGAGLTFVLEITHIVNELHLQNELDANELNVRIVPFKRVPEEAQVSIGRVSVFRQGR